MNYEIKLREYCLVVKEICVPLQERAGAVEIGSTCKRAWPTPAKTKSSILIVSGQEEDISRNVCEDCVEPALQELGH